jgi:hypothetical protein
MDKHRMSDLIAEVLSWFPFCTFRRLMATFGLEPADYSGIIIDPIKPSTITVGGYFTNVALHEERDINKFKQYAVDPIVKIGSNFGEHFADGYTDPPPKVKTSKRGRKPKPKKAKTRIQGSGKYFNSQITSCVRSLRNSQKLYKIKKFRNGKFQVPGVLESDMADVEVPLKLVAAMLGKIFEKDVDIRDKVVQMRNCKTILSDPALTINTTALGKIIEADKNSTNEMRIDKVEYVSAQNASKVVVKFSRPTKDKSKKQTTLKVLKQKINIEGAVGKDGVDEIYYWLNDVLLDNYDKVINDPDAAPLVSESSDTEDESSDADDSDDDNAGGHTRAYDPYDFA